MSTFVYQVTLLNRCIDPLLLHNNMSAVIAVIALWIIGWWWRHSSTKKTDAPGPRGWPIIGVVPMLARNPHVKLTDWSAKYGPVMKIRVGRASWTVLTTVKVVKEAFVSQGAKFSGRPQNYFTDCVLSSGRDGILFNDGACWKRLKKFAMSAFHRLGAGEKFFENIINVEAYYLTKSLLQHQGQSIDLCSHFLGATANVISTILSRRREDYGTEEFAVQYNMIKKFVLDPERTKLANAVIFLPALRYLPIFRGIVRQGHEDAKSLEDFMKSRIIHQENCADQEDQDCLVDIFKSKEYRGDFPDMYTEKNLTYVARDLFLAGTETTTTTLLWCVLALVHDLDLQEKIRAEIDLSFRPGNSKYAHHRHAMPLTFSFIEEVHRYCSVAPLGLPHMTNQDASIGGYKIPKGTTVILNLWGTHRDPNVFKNPDTFDANRFINESGQFAKSLNVISYSTGSRSCLGEKMANVEIFVFLCSILKNFTILPSDINNLPSLNDGVLSTTYSPKPFKVVLSER